MLEREHVVIQKTLSFDCVWQRHCGNIWPFTYSRGERWVPANKTKAFSMKLTGETVNAEKSQSSVCSSGKNLDIRFVWLIVSLIYIKQINICHIIGEDSGFLKQGLVLLYCTKWSRPNGTVGIPHNIFHESSSEFFNEIMLEISANLFVLAVSCVTKCNPDISPVNSEVFH